jgi:hypothetical protein
MHLPKYAVTLISVILFVLLFFEKSLGLNVTLYAAATLVLLFAFKKSFYNPTENKIAAAGFLLTSVFYYLYASPFTLAVTFLSLMLLFGLHTLPSIRNYAYALPNFIPNYFNAIGSFFMSFTDRNKVTKRLKLSRTMRIIFLPLFIILLFLALYSMGSSFFSDALGEVGEAISRFFRNIAKYIDIAVIGVALLGLLFGVVHSLGFTDTFFSQTDSKASNLLHRIRHKSEGRFKFLDLKYEYKSGVFLFATLNLMLLVLLFLEIKNIWFNFEWQGEFLKSLVHEGTYILIISILVSMAITIYFFRKNLNFYKENGLLRQLAYGWIGLNSVLVLSVFIRNAYYIQHFGLAYKRIGVIFFLVLCIVGLVTLVIKIYKLKSTYYIIRVNSLAAYTALVALCAVNWDVYIAKYNFSHYKTAFVHLPFMADLSDKALPYLQVTDEQIAEIESKQVEKNPFAKRGYFEEIGYKQKMEDRIISFKTSYKKKHWLERRWAESKAYDLLSVEENAN